LKGIRVLDFSWVLAGPYATRLLADFGAEVIKVQPPFPGPQDNFSRGYYQTWNRNKLGITLNPGTDEGIRIARELIKISDIIVENFSPRVMSNWGLDYPEAARIKPDIIYLSLSMMGHSGPWLNYSGYGPTVQAFSGMTSLTSYKDGPPVGLGFSYADHAAGLYAALAILAALEYRQRTGEGQYIDLSETEAMCSLLFEAVASYSLKGQAARTSDCSFSKYAPNGIYPCLGEDRWCAISVAREEEWIGFKRVLGNPEWAEDQKFGAMAARVENSAVLNELIGAWTARHFAQEVMELLQKEGIAAGVVQNAHDLAADPQLRARGFFPVLGGKTVDADPIRLSDNPPKYRRPAPENGQDNDYVFRDLLGLSEEDILRCRRDKVI
jgi:benzylsuccinate CoA-transferase BbsF subunit